MSQAQQLEECPEARFYVMSADHGVVPLIQMADLYMPAALPHIVALINKVYMWLQHIIYFVVHRLVATVTRFTVVLLLGQLSRLLFSLAYIQRCDQDLHACSVALQSVFGHYVYA
jgi:hypothetical protein